MHSRLLPALLTLAAAASALAPATSAGEILTKEYKFKLGTLLETQASNEDGLTIDGVQFDPPGGGLLGLGVGAGLHAQVAVSNNGPVPRKAKVAIALFDNKERLLGVAGGGGMRPIKPGQRKFLTLEMAGVGDEAHRATRFYISLETE
jgi:hypothetical protein